VRYTVSQRIATIALDRPDRRNAVDYATAQALALAFENFDADATADVAVFHGMGKTFCSGADLKAIAGGEMNRMDLKGTAPMGPSRMVLGKPAIAAIEGYAVAGGLELALFCDLRVVAEDAVLGVFCRRFGVPLVDGGTIRLPRLIGHARAMDLLLTGRAVGAAEALAIGLATRIAPPGRAYAAALALAREIAAFPQQCLRGDRLSAIEQWDLDFEDALKNEFERGRRVIKSGETFDGATEFAAGAGRSGRKVT